MSKRNRIGQASAMIRMGPRGECSISKCTLLEANVFTEHTIRKVHIIKYTFPKYDTRKMASMEVRVIKGDFPNDRITKLNIIDTFP